MQVITNAEDEEHLEALIDLDASGGVSQGDRTFSPYAECEPMSMHLTCMGVRRCTVYVMSQSSVRSVWLRSRITGRRLGHAVGRWKNRERRLDRQGRGQDLAARRQWRQLRRPALPLAVAPRTAPRATPWTRLEDTLSSRVWPPPAACGGVAVKTERRACLRSSRSRAATGRQASLHRCDEPYVTSGKTTRKRLDLSPLK